MARLREEYRSAGNVRFFDQMKKMLMDEPDRRRKPRSPANSA